MGGERRKVGTGESPAEDDRDDDKEADAVDAVEESIEDTFPASDPPSWSTPAPPEDLPEPSEPKK